MPVTGCPEVPNNPGSLAWTADPEPIPSVVGELPATCGFEPTSSYVETYWLLARTFGDLGSRGGSPARWPRRPQPACGSPVEAHGRSLGLGSDRDSFPVRRTLARLVDFRMAHIGNVRDVLGVRTVIPPLTTLLEDRRALTERAVTDLPPAVGCLGSLRPGHRPPMPASSWLASTGSLCAASPLSSGPLTR